MNSVADGFYEYHTMNASGEDITPASNVINFSHKDKSTGKETFKEYETIIDATEAAKYTKEKVFENAPALFKERIGYGTDGISTIPAAEGKQNLRACSIWPDSRSTSRSKGLSSQTAKRF